MPEFYFTKRAKRDFQKFPPETQLRILQKLKQLKPHNDIFKVLCTVKELPPATHRLRVGAYRLVLELVNPKIQEFEVLKVGHRKDIYQ